MLRMVNVLTADNIAASLVQRYVMLASIAWLATGMCRHGMTLYIASDYRVIYY